MRRLSRLLQLFIMTLLGILFATVTTGSATAMPQSMIDLKSLASPNLGTPLGSILNITTGSSHTCALTRGGDVKCWGDNDAKQLGNGRDPHSTPVKVVGLNQDIKSIAAGAYHTCARTSGGKVWCWGQNGMGQLGDGTNTDSATPVEVKGLSGVTAIAAGAFHTCALIAHGVECWGQNSAGQLGNGETKDRMQPVPVSNLAGAMTALTAGYNHTCVVTSDGAAKCWGGNAFGQLGDGSVITSTVPVGVEGLNNGVTAIAAGGASNPSDPSEINVHTCAVQNGEVKCWGANHYRQLGDGTTDDHATPVRLPPDLLSGVLGLAAGGYHTCAITSSNVQCWGKNTWGQLGNDSILARSTPVEVFGLSTGVIALSAGQEHSCAVVNDRVKCWGNDVYGQLGDGSRGYQPMPTDVFNLNRNVSTVATAGALRGLSAGHTCALTNEGGVKCWGRNTFGQLGNDTNTDSPIPVDVFSSGATGIAVGYGHTCALANSNISCWGYNKYGQLGDGTTANHRTPMIISGLSNMSDLAATYNYTCALTNEGDVKCWGGNGKGQLGDGTNVVSRTTPVSVTGLSSGVRAIAVGGRSSCALTSNGGVKCWGYNFSGQLGNDSTKDSLIPVDVTGLISDVTAITEGMHHGCAVKNGKVKCWGYNEFGQLGNGKTDDSSTPVYVSGLSDVITITAGSYHTCALTSIGGVKCWGLNNFGQLGNKNYTMGKSLTPVDVIGLSSGVRAIAAGMDYTCAVTGSGGAKCWGYNGFGQLGDGNSGRRTTPVDVVEVAPLLSFRPSAYAINESVNTAFITISVDAASDATVTVDVTTHDGTATAGDDYAAIDRQLIFAPGVISQTIPIQIFNDTAGEGDETFTITLTNAQNAGIDSTTATVTIVEDDNIVIVQDETGNPVANATVELHFDGKKQFSATSDINGRVAFPILPASSTLFARAEISGAQRAGWPYHVYLTNLEITAGGAVQPKTTDGNNGTKLLTMKAANPLVLFDLDVSVEWCSYGPHDAASGGVDTFLAQLRRSLKEASGFLYKVTGGQFAFGTIEVYDCGRHWTDADIQIAASNHVRPYTTPGGITPSGAYTYTSSAQKVSVFFPGFVRMGRAWNRSGSVDAPLDGQDAYRTLVHEILHWAFFLFDEYFLIDESEGLLRPAYCTKQVDKSATADSLQASVMYWHYTNTKLDYDTGELGFPISDIWSPDCMQTEQYQVHGESAWKTMVRLYGDMMTPPRWVLRFPTSGGPSIPGPNMPVELETIRIVPPSDNEPNNLLNDKGELTIHISNQGLLKQTDEVQVFLLKQSPEKSQILDQGTTNLDGAIRLVGVTAQDTVLAVSWDGKLFGSRLIDGSEAGTVRLELANAAWSPLITAQPTVDSQGNETGIAVRVSQVSGPLVSLQVTLIPVGGASLVTRDLLPDDKGVYAGSIPFPAGMSIPEAHLLLRATRQQGENPETLLAVTTYGIGGAPGSHGRSYPPKDPASNDGYCTFYLPNGTFSSAAPAIVLPARGAPPLPLGRKMVSAPCYLGVPSDTVFHKSAPLILYYNQRVTALVDTNSLQVDRLDETTGQWVNKGGVPNVLNDFISTAVDQPGLYVVTAALPNPIGNNIYLPLVSR